MGGGSGGSGSGGRSGGGGGIEGTGIQSLDAAAETWAKENGKSIAKEGTRPDGLRKGEIYAGDARREVMLRAKGLVDIDGDRIVVKTPRKNEISEHAKSLGYKYNSGKWSKQVRSFSEAHSELRKLGTVKGLIENNRGDIKEVMRSKD